MRYSGTHSEHYNTSKGYHGGAGCSYANGMIALSGTADKAIYLDNQEFITPSFRFFGYVAMFDTLGGFKWLRKAYPSINNTGEAYASSPLLDNQGNVYLLGQYREAPLTFEGSNDKTFPESSLNATFLVKYDNTGEYKWGLSASGDGYVYPGTITADGDGHVYFSGTNSSDFTITDQN